MLVHVAGDGGNRNGEIAVDGDGGRGSQGMVGGCVSVAEIGVLV